MIENVPMRIVRSRRKTIALEIELPGVLVVRAPAGMDDGEIYRFLREQSPWIQAHLEQVQRQAEQAREAPLTLDQVQALADRALVELPPKVARFAARMGVSYGRITVRNQTTRWGSCTAQGNLNFNCLLMLAPERVVDYVVVHELAHRKQMNHSAAFWQEVAKVMPDYRDSVEWLRKNGGTLLARMRQGLGGME